MIFTEFDEFLKVLSLREGSRIGALDIGDKKIGLAFSDISLTISNPKDVIMRQNISKDIGIISRMFRENNTGAVVIGYPLELDGSEGEPCSIVKSFSNKLLKKINLPILLFDERFTTRMAQGALKETGMHMRDRNRLDDKVAASLVLQVVLDKLSSKRASEEL